MWYSGWRVSQASWVRIQTLPLLLCDSGERTQPLWASGAASVRGGDGFMGPGVKGRVQTPGCNRWSVSKTSVPCSSSLPAFTPPGSASWPFLSGSKNPRITECVCVGGSAAPPQSPSWAWAEEGSCTDAVTGAAPPHDCVSFSLRVTATLDLRRPRHWLLSGPREDKTLLCILLSA